MSETDSNQSQFMRSRVLRSQYCNVSLRLEMDSDSARHILQRRGPGGLMHIEIRCLAVQQWFREKRLSVARVNTKDSTADLFTKHLEDRERSISQGKLDFEFWKARMTTESF